MTKEGATTKRKEINVVIKKDNKSNKPKKVKGDRKQKEEKKVDKKVRVKEEKKVRVKEEKVRVKEEKKVEEAPARRARRVVNKESILADLNNLILCLQNEIDSFKLQDPKAKKALSVKYAKGVMKRLNQLQSDCKRSIKERKTSTRANNNSSGFLKPVKISAKLAKFTGWDPKEEKSRVDVTKFLCNYIREHDLQTPADRRIIKPDASLKGILQMDDSSKPLTYYTLQQAIQHHFV